MSLRFYLGGSGAGKSTKLYKELIQRSMINERQNFLVIVPDQFTMQTQKDLVRLHERGGILNIDVLSFSRLAHRIFEEVGGDELPVLDDTGKSLVLRKVAADLKEQLPVLGSRLDRQGYIHEVKSGISEFMQYGLSVKDVGTLIDYAQKRGSLCYKLKDLATLYEGFQAYIKDRFVTTEETLDQLCKALPKSQIIPGSVVVFDGFTGFTPIQNRVIQKLMELTEEVIVTLTMEPEVSDNLSFMKYLSSGGEQDLFALSKKTALSLIALAKEVSVPRGQDVICDANYRHIEAPSLAHLEKHMLRYPVQSFEKDRLDISIFEASSISAEVHSVACKMMQLIHTGKYQYRDMAVVCGNLEAYADLLTQEFEMFQIPCFMDQTKGIVLNPFIEYIKSVFAVLKQDFSYSSVFQLLRCGMFEFDKEQIDLLENYVIKTGIRGQKKWGRPFARPVVNDKEDGEALKQLNDLRQQFMLLLKPVCNLPPKGLVKDYVEGLYSFLVESRAAEKLALYEAEFKNQGNLVGAKEYGQIYRLVMDLLDQVVSLLAEEEMTLEEFGDILEAGFGEIEVGTIPQNVDRVVVGDIERTRLKEIKVLFFLGVNDGNIPKSGNKGGIISDIDREFLAGSGMELAPTPRQQMFIQKLYLYMNMTKPTKQLILSFSKVDGEGKSLRPAYLIDTVCKLFPTLKIEHPEKEELSKQIWNLQSGMSYLSSGLRDYVAGYETNRQPFFTLYKAYQKKEGQEILDKLTRAAFVQYREQSLGKDLAKLLYGHILRGSVSRLENFASCAYKHFLTYGLALKERVEFGFESVDMGNVFHEVLHMFADRLEESGYTWFNFPKTFSQKVVSEAMEAVASTYGDTILYSSARNAYAIGRMERILNRSVETIQYQLCKGTFTPESYELSFSSVSDLESVNIALSSEERMQLSGRIDRVDIYENDKQVYVKVVDYKSGEKHFDIVALYHGLQLQLVVYMNAAMELQKKKHPDKEVEPAALLYYHVEDPVIETQSALTPEELNDKIVESLRTTGVVNSSLDMIKQLDQDLTGKSQVVPVELKVDGTVSAYRSKTLQEDQLQMVSQYVSQKVKETGKRILEGEISINPYENGNKNACTYCAFQAVCGFDPSIQGFEKRDISGMTGEEALEAIAQEVENSGL